MHLPIVIFPKNSMNVRQVFPQTFNIHKPPFTMTTTQVSITPHHKPLLVLNLVLLEQVETDKRHFAIFTVKRQLGIVYIGKV